MKYESIGSLIGSLVGAVGTGIVVYFTGSVWSAVISFGSFFLGREIGKIFDKKK